MNARRIARSLCSLCLLTLTSAACVEPPPPGMSTPAERDMGMRADMPGDATMHDQGGMTEDMPSPPDAAPDMNTSSCEEPCEVGVTICDETSGQCVRCVEGLQGEESGCSEGRPICVVPENGGERSCQQCEAKGNEGETDHCTTLAPRCDESGTCVECLNDTHCGEARPLCKGGTCMSCEIDPTNPNGPTLFCQMRSQGQRNYCDMDAGCVECVTDDQCQSRGASGEDVKCVAHVCDQSAPIATPIGDHCTRDNACEGYSQDESSTGCITHQTSNPSQETYFCAHRATGANSDECTQRPWTFSSQRVSRGGTMANYCLVTASVSAEAVRNHIDDKACPNGDLDCPGDGAKCYMGTCTYECSTSRESCPQGEVCNPLLIATLDFNLCVDK